MKSLLSDLWRDGFHLNGEVQRESAEKKELTALLERHRELLMAALPQSEAETLEKYEDCFWDMMALANKENFILGFRFGVRLLLEALSDE